MKKKFFLAFAAGILVPALAFATTAGEVVEEAGHEAAAEASNSILNSPIIPSLGEFIPMLIAFAVILFVLSKFVWPTVVKVLDERAEKIEDSLKKAEEAKIEAEDIKAEYQQKLVDARKESADIIESGKSAGEATKSDIVARAEAQAAEIVAKAHAAVEVEKAKAAADLQGSAADLALAIASKVLGEKLTAEADGKLIDRYIAEMGSLNG